MAILQVCCGGFSGRVYVNQHNAWPTMGLRLGSPPTMDLSRGLGRPPGRLGGGEGGF